MKKIYDYDINNARIENDSKVSPFAIFEGERLNRFSLDRPCGIWLSDVDKEICKSLAEYLVLTSELIYRLLANKGLPYEKKEIQNRLSKLTRSGYVQKIGFETDTGYSAAKAYILLGRGVGLVNSLGIRCKLGGYLAEQDHVGLKRILSSNQLLINGKYDNVKVAGMVLIEPQNENEISTCLFRPTATCFNSAGEAYRFVESVRRIPMSKADLCDKLERMVKVIKAKKNANLVISDDISVIVVAEDYQHACELMVATKGFRKKLNILFTFDLAVYSSEDFLYEYFPDKSENIFKKVFASCF